MRGASVTTLVRLLVLLVVTALVVPGATVGEAPVALVKVDRATGADRPRDVVWFLALGSDARAGQSVTRSRADAIQLVGVNLRTGGSLAIGIPRDSYVSVPGAGRDKINAAMVYGGPEGMARAVAGMVGIRPDYVVVASFYGFARMVDRIGGISVRSRYAFSDPVRPRGYKRGWNELNGVQAMIFSRIRKSFPRGDFDRSANQQETLRGILRRLSSQSDRAGFLERGVLAAGANLHTDLPPGDLFRLAVALSTLDPSRMRGCVIGGRTGSAGAASVVFPDIGQARSIARRARADARLEGAC